MILLILCCPIYHQHHQPAAFPSSTSSSSSNSQQEQQRLSVNRNINIPVINSTKLSGLRATSFTIPRSHFGITTTLVFSVGLPCPVQSVVFQFNVTFVIIIMRSDVWAKDSRMMVSAEGGRERAGGVVGGNVGVGVVPWSHNNLPKPSILSSIGFATE